jgi:hypothetical protein
MAVEVSAEFLAAVRSSHTRTARVVSLASNLVELESYELDTSILIEGSVSVDRNRAQRRTVSARIANPEGAYSPIDLEGPFGLLQLVRIDRGISLPTGTEWVPLGVFVVENPRPSVSAGASTLTFQGTDRTKILADSTFSAPRSFGAGTRVSDIIRSLAEEAGMGTLDELYNLDDDSSKISDTVSWPEEMSRLDACLELAAAHALELFPDPDGILVLRPIPDPNTAPVAFEFAPGETSIMTGIESERSASQLFNRVVVVGESANFGPFRGEARDLNPASPIYNPVDGTGPVGDRPAPIIRSALIGSSLQAQQVARAELPKVALIEESVYVTMAPHPALDASDIVLIDETLTRSGGRYMIDTLEVPIGAGTMSMTTKRVRSLSA